MTLRIRRRNRRMHHSPRVSRLAAVLATLAIIVAGCTGGGAPASAGASAAGSPAGGSPAASGGAAGASLAASETIDRVKAAGVLRVGYAPALPWLGQNPQTNEWFGPNHLLGQRLAERLGVKLEPVTQTFDQLVPAIQAGTIDVGLSPMFITETRLQAIDMVPWTEAGTCYLIREDETRFKTVADLNNPDVRITGFVGTGTTQQIQKTYPNAKLVLRQQAPGEEINYIPVQQGEADAAPFDSPLAIVYGDAFPGLKLFPEDCLQNPDLPTDIGVGIRKGDAGLAQLLEQMITELQPEIAAELEKYSDPQYLKPQS
jgi:polar amino acid transport system substrate-binding protein